MNIFMKRIAVLITVFNRRKATLRCLKDLYNQVYDHNAYQIHVYLTNDGCTDGTPEAIKKEFPEVKIIEGNGSLFWNRGMYVAWSEAEKGDYDFYLWLNDDTFIYNNTILRLLNESKQYDDKAIIVGSTCSVGNPSKITYGGYQNGELIEDITVAQWSDAINGNIVLIPRNVYKILGKNDPYYRHAVGDTDYGLRAKSAGVPCYTGIGIFGECNLHEHPTIWMDPSQPFKKRWKNFFSPIGNNPFEFFYFKRKHFGLIKACVVFCSNWIHFFFPWLWPNSYKDKK